MDTRPIGVFDSGLGGLTALRELARLMPQEDLVYFGDTGRVPYGSRSKETIIKYAQQDVAFLSTFDPKAIVIACGTVSTTALDTLRQQYAVPLYGVVEPAVVETVVKEYLEEVKAQEVDTLMLGCTHYPLLREVIGACMGPEVELVDVGAECARWVMGQLSGRDQLAPQDRKGSHRYFVSDSTGDFAALASMFLGEDVTGDVGQIDITVY